MLFFDAIWFALPMSPSVLIGTFNRKITKVTIRNCIMKAMDEPIRVVISAKLIVIGKRSLKSPNMHQAPIEE